MNFADVDSYIISHHKIYPAGMSNGMLYGVARGEQHDTVTWFGLQYILLRLEVPTMEMIDRIRVIANAHFGRDDVFNYEGWKYIVELGYYPLRICALPEGTEAPKGTALFTVENTDDSGKLGWLPGWFETQMVRAWYPTNVATISRNVKRTIKKYLDKNGTPDELMFKLQDFGSRGATCSEAADIAGMAHLINFYGTDTFHSLLAAMENYDAPLELLGVSIPASAHATITSWGRDWEIDAYRNMILQYGGEGKMYACVSDSYNIWKALEMWKALEPVMLEVGGRLIVRPDSGDPVDTPVGVVVRLLELFGFTINAKGYKVLPDHIRVIQGDGINGDTVTEILERLDAYGISADNIGFGMGGALAQQHDRGTNDIAMKMCWCLVGSEERDVWKDPVGDVAKRSLKGRLRTVVDLTTGVSTTVTDREFDASLMRDQMRVAYENGVLYRQNFVDIRAIAA